MKKFFNKLWLGLKKLITTNKKKPKNIPKYMPDMKLFTNDKV